MADQDINQSIAMLDLRLDAYAAMLRTIDDARTQGAQANPAAIGEALMASLRAVAGSDKLRAFSPVGDSRREGEETLVIRDGGGRTLGIIAYPASLSENAKERVAALALQARYAFGDDVPAEPRAFLESQAPLLKVMIEDQVQRMMFISPPMAEHFVRVMEVEYLLGQAIERRTGTLPATGLEGMPAEYLAYAGGLHDIGKLGIGEFIQSNPLLHATLAQCFPGLPPEEMARLKECVMFTNDRNPLIAEGKDRITPEHWENLQTAVRQIHPWHTTAGGDVLRTAPLDPIGDIIYHHAGNNKDGARFGYEAPPDGVAMSPLANATALCDKFEAMVGPRRLIGQAMTVTEAVDALIGKVREGDLVAEQVAFFVRSGVPLRFAALHADITLDADGTKTPQDIQALLDAKAAQLEPLFARNPHERSFLGKARDAAAHAIGVLGDAAHWLAERLSADHALQQEYRIQRGQQAVAIR